eukprot:gene41842-56659_t
MSTGEALGITLGVTIVYQLLFFFIAAYFKFDIVTDLAGGSNFVVLAVLIFLLNCIPVPSSRQWANTVLVILWGIRLSGFLLYRVLAFTKDNRFDDIRENFFKFLFFWIFQMVWVWVVSLPLTYLNSINDSARPTLDSADIVGITMASLGLVIEAWLDPVKKNTWCTDGLWKYSRHPNYFGELLFWWGIFISCSQSFYQHDNTAFYTILSPVFITLLLLGFSGMPILEKSANKKYGSIEEFQKYRKETSILVIMPNADYRNLPDVLKCVLLFEWPVYRAGLDDLTSVSTRTKAAPLLNT